MAPARHRPSPSPPGRCWANGLVSVAFAATPGLQPEPAGTLLGQWQGTGSRTVSFSSCQETWGLADIWDCPSSASALNHTVAVYQPSDTTALASFGGELGPGQGIDSWGTPEFSRLVPNAGVSRRRLSTVSGADAAGQLKTPYAIANPKFEDRGEFS